MRRSRDGFSKWIPGSGLQAMDGCIGYALRPILRMRGSHSDGEYLPPDRVRQIEEA